MSRKGVYPEDLKGLCANCRFMSVRHDRCSCAKTGNPINRSTNDCPMYSPCKGSVHDGSS